MGLNIKGTIVEILSNGENVFVEESTDAMLEQ